MSSSDEGFEDPSIKGDVDQHRFKTVRDEGSTHGWAFDGTGVFRVITSFLMDGHTAAAWSSFLIKITPESESDEISIGGE